MYRRLMNWLANRSAAAVELRRAPRVPEPSTVVYYWNGSAPIGHQLRDVSMSGAYLYTTERWYPGTVVRLLLQEPPPDDCERAAPRLSVSLPARVVWHGADGMALEFLFRSPEDRTRLERLIAGYPDRRSAGGEAA